MGKFPLKYPDRPTLLSLVAWLLVGEFIGWLCATLSLGLAEVGFGSIVPIVLALSSALIPALYFYDEYFELTGAALYACYTGWIWIGWQLGLRRLFARMVLVFHLLSVVLAGYFSRAVIGVSEPDKIKEIWEQVPVWSAGFVAVLLVFYGTVFLMAFRPQIDKVNAGSLAAN